MNPDQVETHPKPLKAWFTYKRDKDGVIALMLLENGWVPFQQGITQVDWIIPVLWDSKMERQEVFSRMGYKVIYDEIPIPLADLPKEILERNKDPKLWSDFAREYERKAKAYVKELTPDVET